MPKVSVIIPVYNVEEYLNQCLNSVIRQTLQDIEIICVDDGSTDHSLEILKSYERSDPRIKVITVNHKSAGVARNIGLEHATGQFVHFLDSDDWIEADLYEQSYQAAKNHQADVCMFHYNEFDNVTGATNMVKLFGLSRVSQGKEVTNLEEATSFFLYNAVVPWNKLYKKDFLIENKIYFDDLVCANDRAFYFRVIKKAKRIFLLNQAFVNYRINNKNSLVGEARLKNFSCHFEASNHILALFKDESMDIQKQVVDVCMRDLFHFYHRAHGEQKRNIAKQMQIFFSTLAIDELMKSLSNSPWFLEYQTIRAMDGIQVSNEEIQRIKHILPLPSSIYRNPFALFSQKIRSGIRCYKEYGMRYTWRRLKKHLHIG